MTPPHWRSLHHRLLPRILLPVLLLIFVLTSAAATSTTTTTTDPFQPNITELDCGMRALAYDLAMERQPWLAPHRDTWDSLELGTKCGMTAPDGPPDALPPVAGFPVPPSGPDSAVLYVAVNGSDSTGDGSKGSPFATLPHAVDVARNDTASRSSTIVLRAGLHFLTTQIRLTSPLDDGLTIMNYPQERVWVSGGVSLTNVTWTPASSESGMPPGVWQADLTSFKSLSDVTGLFSASPHRRFTLARYPNADAETQRQELDASLVLEWTKPAAGPVPTFQFVNLTDPANPTGIVKDDSTMVAYNSWGVGSGGVCDTVWGPNSSYWCGNNSAGGWAFVDQDAAKAGRLNIPVGLTFDDKAQELARFAKWSDPAGGLLFAGHSQGWATHMFEMSGKKDNVISFSRGGWQGGRNWCRCDQCPYAGGWCGQHKTPPQNNDTRMISQGWHVEGIKEELDVPTEFWFDRSRSVLYFYPNASHPTTDGLITPVLETLFYISASRVSLRGLGIRDAAKTYMKQSVWGVPSGGDWALGRIGAVYLEGSSSVTLDSCVFRRVDGNAVFLSRRNRYTTVRRCDFAWTGDGAMATWGEVDGFDATAGNQPQYSLIEDNYIRELGLYELQSSGWGQAKTANTALVNNIMFNMPRAAINLNDGLGPNTLNGSMLWNTCRHSGDHGSINSWNREPFLTMGPNGTKSWNMGSPTTVIRSFIIANYGSSQGVDNDDGSSFFHTKGNVFYSADGFKMDYGGHDSHFSDNLVIVSPYDHQNCVNVGSFKEGHGDVVDGNTCVVLPYNVPAGENKVVMAIQCNSSDLTLSQNKYYTLNGNASVQCENRAPVSLATAQELYGYEVGSTAHPLPTAATMVAWAKAWYD